MKVTPQDQTKAVGMLVVIAICVVFIVATLIKYKNANDQKTAAATPGPNIVAGSPSETAALEPNPQDPKQYIRNIEAWSQPPAAFSTANPFQEVLPRALAQSLRSHMAPPPRQISGNGFGGNGIVNPTVGGLPQAMIDFPTIKVQGVVVDTSNGTPTDFAVVQIDNKPPIYAKDGDVIGNGLKVDKVTELGVWVWAAKEHAFIEVDKPYKPTGMAPPAPPKPAASGHRHHARRHA